MQSIIDVFRMVEVDPKVRAKIIVKLGRAINAQSGYNMTEPIVLELVRQLDPANTVCSDKHYLHVSGEISDSDYMEYLRNK